MRISALLLGCAAISLPAVPLLAKDHEEMAESEALTYPETKTVDVIEEQFGEYISDPYRWLENDVREDEAVAAWVAAQNAVTDAHLEKLKGRDVLAGSMAKPFDYDQLNSPLEAGGQYFHLCKSGC